MPGDGIGATETRRQPVDLKLMVLSEPTTRDVFTLLASGQVVIAEDATNDELRKALQVVGESYYSVRMMLPAFLLRV